MAEGLSFSRKEDVSMSAESFEAIKYVVIPMLFVMAVSFACGMRWQQMRQRKAEKRNRRIAKANPIFFKL